MATLKSLVAASTCSMLSLTGFAWSQTSAEVPSSLVTPDKVETRLGTLEFKNGAPSAETLTKIYDNLDFAHAFDALVNTYQGVNMAAIRKGFLSIGVKDNELLIFSKLMDASSLFLTANADTVYFLGCIDLSNGPMVLETPPKALGTMDDFWWRWVIDFGAPGPDRGSRSWSASPWRRGRQVFAAAARLRWAIAGRRLLYRPFPHHARGGSWAQLHGTRRPEAYGQFDQGEDQDLLV